MSQKPRGRNDPRQAWGNQSGGGGGSGGGGNGNNGGNSRRQQPGQNPPNFADSNAFGPPLGGRARPNRQGGGKQKFKIFPLNLFACIHILYGCCDISLSKLRAAYALLV